MEKSDSYLYNRCDICIEEQCKKAGREPGSCNCKECKNFGSCPKILHATIRITNKCTQECSHCCFSSSPKSEIHMTPEIAKKIQSFINSNGVLALNIMGGEFFCNPQWYEILKIFLESNAFYMRLVSNGDWYGRGDVKEKLESLIEAHKDKLKISITYDRYHTNSWTEHGLDGFLKLTGVKYNAERRQIMDDMGIVPVGRAYLTYSFYSFMGTYCSDPCNRYSFLIDENGQVYSCGFGICPFANIKDYLEGGFRPVFKDHFQWFSRLPLLSCSRCIEAFEMNKSIVDKRGFKILERV